MCENEIKRNPYKAMKARGFENSLILFSDDLKKVKTKAKEILQIN